MKSLYHFKVFLKYKLQNYVKNTTVIKTFLRAEIVSGGLPFNSLIQHLKLYLLSIYILGRAQMVKGMYRGGHVYMVKLCKMRIL